jgi:hypothetical protein
VLDLRIEFGRLDNDRVIEFVARGAWDGRWEQISAGLERYV